MSLVNPIADRLSNEVIGDRETGEAVVEKQLPMTSAVLFASGSLIDVEVVSPASELEAVVAHFLCFWRQLLQGKVGPLSGEQSNSS